MRYDVAAFVLTALVALVAAALVGRSRTWVVPGLLVAAVALRIAGSELRHVIIFRYYEGFGDAVLYFENGQRLLERHGFLGLFDLQVWFGGANWWGTRFLNRVTALVAGVTGPSLRAEFLVFSLLAFVGLYLAAAAFRNVGPQAQVRHMTLALWLWPSLWFWPSSIGKEALITLAIGLAVYGYAGKRGRVHWLPFLSGMGLAFCIRPHVAAVLAMSAMIGHWLGSWGKITFRRVVEAALAVVIAVYAFQGMTAQFGLDQADLEGVREFVEFRSDLTLKGGSQVGTVGDGLAGVPMALVNTWLRPFPWEAHNLTSLIAAAELTFLWGLILLRRREVLLALRHWRRHRLLLFGLPFLLIYTLMIGLTFGNLGIIARQRSPAFVFAFFLVLAVPQRAPQRSARTAMPPASPRRLPAGRPLDAARTAPPRGA